MQRHLPLAIALACFAATPGAAQEAGILPPLVGVTANWDQPPTAMAASFRAAGWTSDSLPPGATAVRLAGNWLGFAGTVTLYPSKDHDQVRSMTFQATPAPQDTVQTFLALVDSLTARFGPPTGWGIGGLYKKERVLAAGVLEVVWRAAGSSGDYLHFEVMMGALKLSIRSAAYHEELMASARESRRRWDAAEQKDKPIVDPSHIYESWQVKTPAWLTNCLEKPPKTGYRGRLTITGVVAPWGRLFTRVSLASLTNVPYRVQEALEDWVNNQCLFVPGMIDGTFVYSRTTFTVDIDS